MRRLGKLPRQDKTSGDTRIPESFDAIVRERAQAVATVSGDILSIAGKMSGSVNKEEVSVSLQAVQS